MAKRELFQYFSAIFQDKIKCSLLQIKNSTYDFKNDVLITPKPQEWKTRLKKKRLTRIWLEYRVVPNRDEWRSELNPKVYGEDLPVINRWVYFSLAFSRAISASPEVLLFSGSHLNAETN